jgi:hypothetical protein
MYSIGMSGHDRRRQEASILVSTFHDDDEFDLVDGPTPQKNETKTSSDGIELAAA